MIKGIIYFLTGVLLSILGYFSVAWINQQIEINAKGAPAEIFFHISEDLTVPAGREKIEYKEIWVRYSSGKEELIVAPKEDPDPKKAIIGIRDAQLSTDGKRIFFRSVLSDNTDAIHMVDIASKQVKFICAGHFFQLATSGPYNGKLIIHKHPEGGTCIGEHYFIFNQNGQQLEELGEAMPVNTYNLAQELKKLDFSSPEKTLAYYFQCLEKGDCKGIGISGGESQPWSSAQDAQPKLIKNYEILKKTIYSQAYIEELRSKNELPSLGMGYPEAGYIELRVQYTWAVKNKETDQSWQVDHSVDSFWFRQSGQHWFLGAFTSGE